MSYVDFHKRNSMIWDGDLSSSETLLLIAFTLWTDAEGKCFPGVKLLAERTKLTERAIRKILNALVGKKILTKRSQYGKSGAQSSNLYQINYFAIPQGGVNSVQGGRNSVQGGAELSSAKLIQLTNPIELINSPDRAIDNFDKSADAESLISNAAESPLESPLNPENESTYLNTSEDTSQAILEQSQSIYHLSLEQQSISYEEKDPPAARVTKVAKPSLRSEQVARAKKFSLCQQGIDNDRWDDLEDFKKFRAYVTQQAHDRTIGTTAGAKGTVHGEDWIEGVMVNTAKCQDDTSPVLGLWRCWQQEIPPPPLFVATEEPDSQPLSQATKDMVAAYLAKNLEDKERRKAEQSKYKDRSHRCEE